MGWGDVQNTGNSGNGVSLGTVSLAFAGGGAVGLPSIPKNAKSAIICLEANAANPNMSRVAHFSSSIIPTAILGLPLGDNDPFEVIGYTNLQNFKIISIVDFASTLQIEYFS